MRNCVPNFFFFARTSFFSLYKVQLQTQEASSKCFHSSRFLAARVHPKPIFFVIIRPAQLRPLSFAYHFIAPFIITLFHLLSISLSLSPARHHLSLAIFVLNSLRLFCIVNSLSVICQQLSLYFARAHVILSTFFLVKCFDTVY